MTIRADIQSLAPTALLDLFILDTTNMPDGSLMRFHAGTNQLSQPVVWQGQTYEPMPIQAEGFDLTVKGALPRPKLKVANVNGYLSASVKSFNDFVGCKVTRKRTFAKYLDEVNFPTRRNLLLQSEALNASPWSGSVSATLSGDMYAGSSPFWTLAKTVTNTSESRAQSLGTVAQNSVRTVTIALMAESSTSVSVGLRGASGWGNVLDSSGEIISGPGTLSTYAGALRTVSGLSDTEPTVLRVTRTYMDQESGGVYIYPGTPTSTVIGASVKATRVQVEADAVPTDYQPVGASWSGNPYADPNQFIPDDLWYVERKVTENRYLIEFELSSAFDLMGQQLPSRQIIQNTCSWKYRGTECGWAGANYDKNNTPSTIAEDACAKTLAACKVRFSSQPIRFGGFPGAIRGTT
jgi:phage-related protein